MNPKVNSRTEEQLVCYHCGASTRTGLKYDSKDFCCQGCASVYRIVNENGLCDYYSFSQHPGKTMEADAAQEHRFAFLKDVSILNQLKSFEDDQHIHLTYYLPHVHCSSCLYLLEQLHRMVEGVTSAKLNFSQKELNVVFDKKKTNAFDIAIHLSKLGYEPYFSLNDLSGKQSAPRVSRDKLYRLGVAGFAFGNIMLLSFPEYFAYGTDLDGLKPYFQWIMLFLIIPVITYSSMEFYRLAWGGLKERYLNIDLPIVFAMFITFFRSMVEIFTHTGPGYLDSLSGIVFFMLLGRFVQDKTHKAITFNRDFSSYFPISTTVFNQGREVTVPLPSVKVDDELIIHAKEIIPVDGLLVSGKAIIDYSFVTGESEAVELEVGSVLYAGGRQLGSNIRVMAQKTVSQSYLVSLWNKEKKPIDQKVKSRIESNYVQKASMYFTIGVFVIALSTALFWSFNDPTKIWSAVTAILIIACPCALLLSVTFTHGHFLSLLAKNGFYAKGAKVLERMLNINRLVYDKTGTITDTHKPWIQYEGDPLSLEEKDMVASLAKDSIHPYARKITPYLEGSLVALEDVHNHEGEGVMGYFKGIEVRLGKADYCGLEDESQTQGSKVYLSIGEDKNGCFIFQSALRKNLIPSFRELIKSKHISILSGDNDNDKKMLMHVLPSSASFLFKQKPQDKKRYIQNLQQGGEQVMMVGDGLNDAGALMDAEVGVAVAEDISYFTPGSDAIVLGGSLQYMHRFFAMVKGMRRIIWFSFAFSIIYNLIGLSFAVTGELNPIIAAILMPSSSISIVLITWIGSYLIAWKNKFKL